MRRHPDWTIACLLFLCFTDVAVAAGNPIDIEADQAEFDERNGTSFFLGNVRLQRGTLSITADKITLYRVGKQLDRTVAEGHPARYSQKLARGGEIRAEAEKMEYFATTEELHMIGKARLWHDKNRFSGERIIYHIRSDKIQAESNNDGKQRVHATIYPDENQ